MGNKATQKEKNEKKRKKMRHILSLVYVLYTVYDTVELLYSSHGGKINNLQYRQDRENNSSHFHSRKNLVKEYFVCYSQIYIFKVTVSRDWKGLLMVLLD
jgi:hypothetical protein